MKRVLTLPLGVLLGCLGAVGCAPGTGGQLTEIDVELVIEGQGDAAPGSFETQTGYRVELEDASLAVSSVLAYAPDVAKSLSLSWLVCGHALAHGGYDPFNGRVVRAELSADLELDLLASAPVQLGVIEAETGPMDTASVLFGERVAGEPGQAHVRGVATKDGDRIEFEGTLQLEDEALLRRVDGIPAKGSIAPGGTLQLVVRPRLWFEEAHFDRLDADADGLGKVTADSQVHTAWVFGTRSTRSYGMRWRKP